MHYLWQLKTDLTVWNGSCGQMISSCAGDLPWIITVKSCILILNSSSICNSSSMNSGCS